MSWCYDGTNGCFIDSNNGFFIDTTCGFFISKCYIRKRSHDSRKKTRRRISSIISIALNVINLKEKQSKKTHWVSLFIYRNTAAYFDYLGIKYIRQEDLNKIKDKSIPQNIFRTKDDDFIMCGFYCIVFIEYMIAGRTLSNYTNFFSNDYENNEKIIYKYFKDKFGKRKRKP